MAVDAGLVELIRDDLSDEPGITERRMFGGLCFLKDGNMVAAVHGSGGAMFRVGKTAEAAALEISGAAPMEMTGRRMGGFVDVRDPDALADDTRRLAWLALALDHARTLAPK